LRRHPRRSDMLLGCPEEAESLDLAFGLHMRHADFQNNALTVRSDRRSNPGAATFAVIERVAECQRPTRGEFGNYVWKILQPTHAFRIVVAEQFEMLGNRDYRCTVGWICFRANASS
jgi:hypothetical protein